MICINCICVSQIIACFKFGTTYVPVLVLAQIIVGFNLRSTPALGSLRQPIEGAKFFPATTLAIIGSESSRLVVPKSIDQPPWYIQPAH